MSNSMHTPEAGMIQTILGQPSWSIYSTRVQAWVTRLGGHLGPITFKLEDRSVMPFHVAPWTMGPLDSALPPLLNVLRGDFFCLPFGSNDQVYHGEQHPPHGETCNREWAFRNFSRTDTSTCLHLDMSTLSRPGHVDKYIRLYDGDAAVYSQHVVTAMSGKMTPGHHATLRFPDSPGSGLISTSAFVYGQTYPVELETPENGGYSILTPGAEFSSLKTVPMKSGETTDLSLYPSRRGFEDIITLVADDSLPFAWTAAVFPDEGYVWFSLKDPRVLHETLFWMSNGGRHYAPWNGKHVNVLGLEEVTGYFDRGLVESTGRNPISDRGYPTCTNLNPDLPLVVNTIMAVAAIPTGFDHVENISCCQGGVVLQSQSKKTIQASIHIDHLHASAGQ